MTSGSLTRAPADAALLPAVVDAAHAAGERLAARYSPDARPADRAALSAALRGNEDAAAGPLVAALLAALPGSRVVDEEQETAPLPAGELWAVDAVEGNVNHVHGGPEWCVTATLLRDGVPVLTAVHQPVGDVTHTAVRGAGAHRNGRPLRASAKTDLADAIVTTGQAEAGQSASYGRIGASITAMLHRALLVRATVPSTFPLLLVAAGHADVFWQYQTVTSGVAAGVLLATEAGAVVSRVDGRPWAPGSPDVLVAAPALHAAAVDVLSSIA